MTVTCSRALWKDAHSNYWHVQMGITVPIAVALMTRGLCECEPAVAAAAAADYDDVTIADGPQSLDKFKQMMARMRSGRHHDAAPGHRAVTSWRDRLGDGVDARGRSRDQRDQHGGATAPSVVSDVVGSSPSPPPPRYYSSSASPLAWPPKAQLPPPTERCRCACVDFVEVTVRALLLSPCCCSSSSS